MYANKMAVAIKTNGRVLRENKDTVYCPFGSEYSILLKNLNTVRAVVNVYIDGENQTPGGLVLNAHQEVDLQRSLKNGNLMEGNRFKFIERTGAVENHRGIKLEDGIVRIEYQFEMSRPIIFANDMWKNNIVGASYTNDVYYGNYTNISGSTGSVLRGQSMNINDIQCSVTNASATSATMDSYVPQNDAGITVPGSKSDQKFQTVHVGALDPQTHSIVLKILGETPDNEPVRKPVTTKHKPKCVTCGKQNKATAKFCTECGTALEIFA